VTRGLLLANRKNGVELKDQKKSINKIASRDPLTGLHNRDLFFDCLTRAIALAARNKKVAGVLFICIDRLKLINDTLGENYGNRLLKSLAMRLNACVRKSDIVARPGRDEFLILLPEIRYAEDAALIARKIFASVEAPFILRNRRFFISVNIGISVYPNDSDNAKALLNTSYTALQRARELGENTYQFYSPALTERAFERMVMENDLKFALQRKEFLLHYQPQIDLKTGMITGVEALVRWRTPQGNLVYPKKFLYLMEETGLIVQLGELVLFTACKQNKAWQEAGLKPIRVAVNISARHFHEKDITHIVSRVLEETGLEAKFLELELTESIFLKNLERTVKALKVLRGMGVNISIDDFGTGYSSLSYLKYFPINKLKIVEPFISSVSFSPTDEVIARAIIALAHTLNMKVVAEGVEKKEQMQLIRSLKCDELQGNIFSLPLPPEEITKLLTHKRKLKRLDKGGEKNFYVPKRVKEFITNECLPI
jgi:diguanylate cyclase (GGDEF)-like protein